MELGNIRLRLLPHEAGVKRQCGYCYKKDYGVKRYAMEVKKSEN